MIKSRRVVALIDLCGHEKYLKTTMLGMVGLVPDYVLIVVGANLGLSKMTKEHLGIALALNLPFFIVMTKVDMVKEEITKKTLKNLRKLLNAPIVNKKPFLIHYDYKDEKKAKYENKFKGKEGVKKGKKQVEVQIPVPKKELSQQEVKQLDQAVQMIKSERICPIFQVSSVNGFGIPQLTYFIKNLRSRTNQSNIIGKKSDPV